MDGWNDGISIKINRICGRRLLCGGSPYYSLYTKPSVRLDAHIKAQFMSEPLFSSLAFALALGLSIVVLLAISRRFGGWFSKR